MLSEIQKTIITNTTALYTQCGYSCTIPIAEKESAEYSACMFEVNDFHTRFRIAKITHAKTGQFVTLWKRDESAGPIQPFHSADMIDFFAIYCKKDQLEGIFILPKSVLIEKGIFSTDAREGKRAIRVYPAWDITTNIQAQKTQKWQLKYFVEINKGKTDLIRFKELAHGVYSHLP